MKHSFKHLNEETTAWLLHQSQVEVARFCLQWCKRQSTIGLERIDLWVQLLIGLVTYLLNSDATDM